VIKRFADQHAWSDSPYKASHFVMAHKKHHRMIRDDPDGHESFFKVPSGKHNGNVHPILGSVAS